MITLLRPLAPAPVTLIEFRGQTRVALAPARAAIVTSVGRRGPQGPPGPAGAAGADGATGPQGPVGPACADGDGTFNFIAASPLGGHRLVATDGAGGLAYARCDDTADFPAVLGMTLNAAAAGDPVSVRRVGGIEEVSWAWTPGFPVYLGLNGVPTQTLPPEAVFGLIVGIPSSPTALFMALREPIMFD